MLGGSAAVLATYTMKYEQRSCTDFTGCGSWGPATPSWGPSGSGKVWLKVTASGIIVAVVDNSAGSAYGTPLYTLGMDCTLKPVFGKVLATCARFYGSVKGVKTAGSYKEYRGGFLLRYERIPAPL